MAANNIPDLILFILELIFGTLHGSMCYFIIRKKKANNKLYCSPFYSFYLCIAFMDFVYVLNNEFCAKIARLEFAQKFYEDMTYLASLMYLLSAYSSAGEMVGHTFIAINRYYALKNAQVSEHQWSKRTTNILCALIFVIPFILSIYRLPQDVRYKYPKYGYSSITYTDPVFSKIISLVNMVIYVFVFIPSFISTVLALWNYRKITKQVHIKNTSTKHEMKLFIHSLFMFACFFARFAYQITLLIGSYTKNDSITQTAQFVIANVASFYAFAGSAFLLIISSQVRIDFLSFYHIVKYDSTSQQPIWTSSTQP